MSKYKNVYIKHDCTDKYHKLLHKLDKNNKLDKNHKFAKNNMTMRILHTKSNLRLTDPPRQWCHHPRPQHNEEQRYDKLKFTMPKFSRSNDPKEYLSWAFKVDKIFRLNNYEEEKKIAMASLEFQDYVLIW